MVHFLGSGIWVANPVTYFVQTRWGGSERAPSVERLREVLTELEQPDAEHPALLFAICRTPRLPV